MGEVEEVDMDMESAVERRRGREGGRMWAGAWTWVWACAAGRRRGRGYGHVLLGEGAEKYILETVEKKKNEIKKNKGHFRFFKWVLMEEVWESP